MIKFTRTQPEPKLNHMQIAMGELGQKEVPGSSDNPQIVEYFTATTYHATDDETPWCSAFANWVMMKAGIARTKSAAALSWADWGKKVTKPQYGDIVVWSHGSGRGHVAFYVGEKGDEIHCLGGNQGNAVNIGRFDKSSVYQYRRPKTGWDSTTITAASITGAAAIGGLVPAAVNMATTTATTATTAVTNVASQANEYAGAVAACAAGTPVEGIHNVANILMPFLPADTQLVVQSGITLLSAAWIFKERLMRIWKKQD